MLADAGRMLGKYQLIAEIARGGMGVVYLAMVQGPGGFNKLLVVKELRPDLVEEPAFLTMFLDEARLAARLSHPNIVGTHEVGNDGDRYFMAMDYLDGRGLDQIRRRSRTAGIGLSLPMHLRVICDMLAGLDYAHGLADFDGSPLHIVHRDVSPQNVFVTFDGQVKLLDFGIAKTIDSTHETHTGVVKGKVSYMSPEQGRGLKVDSRSDVFSAGVLLWEALTGKRMREAKHEAAKLWELMSADVPRASSVKPWIPAELDEICARAMAWNRDDRYPSAGVMQRDLESYLTATGTNVSAREVGVCITELFLEDRATTNAVIEAHLARARGGVVRDKLPIIDVASRSSHNSPTPSAGRVRPRSRTETGLATSLDSPSARVIDAPASSAGAPRREGARRVKSVVIAGVTGIIVAAVVVVVIARTTRDTDAARPAPTLPVAAPPVTPAPATPSPATPSPATPSPATPTAATPPASDPAQPPKPSFVDVEIRVRPGHAHVAIDGTEVDGNPFVSRYASDAFIHHVRASAPGYVARSVPVSFTTDVTLDIRLERVATPARNGTRGPRPQPQPPTPPARGPEAAPTPPKPSGAPTAPEIDPAGGTKPRRPIDPTNPYGGAP